MAKIKSGLGRGLSALIPEGKEKITKSKGTQNGIQKININEIKPNKNQPRKNFDIEKLDALADSIKEHGVIQPIVVRIVEKGYEIIAGERRWKASRKAGFKEVPCIIKEVDEKTRMEIALIENLQREDLSPIEEALAYRTLMDLYKLTQEKISQRIGKSRPYIANTVRLLNLTEEMREMVMKNKLSSGHARVLLRIENEKLQNEIGEKIISNQLSVRETENLVTNILEQRDKKAVEKKSKESTLIFLEDLLKVRLGTKVNIIKGKKKGKIEIEYYSEEELERLVSLLKKD